MGCCRSKDTESPPEDEVRGNNTVHRVQPGVGKVYPQPEYGFGRSAQPHTGSRVQEPAGKVYRQPEYGFGHSAQPHTGSRVQEPAEGIFDQQADRIGHNAQHNEERHFFQLFFSVMDHIPGYQGILRRWEKESQQAQFKDGDRCEMGNVWLDGCGYVKSLQRVRLFVANKKFSLADRLKLTEWAMKVVNRRTKQYNVAEGKGKADPKHLKVLEAWRSVKNTLQGLT